MTYVIAHRGIRNEIPENTCESITAAIGLSGLFGVEFDVELADRPVVLHQESKIPNEEFTALKPAVRDYVTRDWISDYSAKAIAQLDAGSWMGSEFSELRVPLLSDVLTLQWANKHAFMELKDPTYWSEPDPERPREIVSAITPLIQNFMGKLELVSFNPAILEEARIKQPHIPRVLALWTEWQDRADEAFDAAMSAEASGVSLPDRMVLSRPEWAEQAHAAGLHIYVYPISPTFEEPEYENWRPDTRVPIWKSLIEIQVDGIVTDFPRELLSMLD